MRIGSLFTGVGGLDLGLEAAGLGEVAWQVELDPFCRVILEKHWPHVSREIQDVKEVKKETVAPVDILCGGFPCTDVSAAGRKEGLKGKNSGLWYEYYRVVCELRPRAVVVENVSSGARRWLPTVRRMLEDAGYRTRALAVSAEDVGAPHLRRRIFVLATLANPSSERGQGRDRVTRGVQSTLARSDTQMADTHSPTVREQSGGLGRTSRGRASVHYGASETMDYPDSLWQSQCCGDEPRCGGRPVHPGQTVGHTESAGLEQLWRTTEPDRAGTPWRTQRGVGGMSPGLPARLDLPTWWPLGQGKKQDKREPPRTIPHGTDRNRCARLKALGNTVVPQCAFLVGCALLDWMEE